MMGDSLRNRLVALRRKLNWSPTDLAQALEATRAEVEGWEAGLWRPREPALELLEALEKGSALYYSGVDDSDEGCPLWHPLRAETPAAAMAEAEKIHSAGETAPRIILAENRALMKDSLEAAGPGFRVVAVWSAKRGWVASD